eukprot:gene16140-17766_t
MSQLQAVSIKPVAEFRPDAEVGASLATRWKDWLDDFEMFLLASGITDKTRKRALLLYQAGPRVREIFKNLTEVGGASDFDVAKNKLTEYFEPQKNRRYEVYRFRQATQEQTETLDQCSYKREGFVGTVSWKPISTINAVERKLPKGQISTTMLVLIAGVGLLAIIIIVLIVKMRRRDAPQSAAVVKQSKSPVEEIGIDNAPNGKEFVISDEVTSANL